MKAVLVSPKKMLFTQPEKQPFKRSTFDVKSLPALLKLGHSTTSNAYFSIQNYYTSREAGICALAQEKLSGNTFRNDTDY